MGIAMPCAVLAVGIAPKVVTVLRVCLYGTGIRAPVPLIGIADAVDIVIRTAGGEQEQDEEATKLEKDVETAEALAAEGQRILQQARAAVNAYHGDRGFGRGKGQPTF